MLADILDISVPYYYGIDEDFDEFIKLYKKHADEYLKRALKEGASAKNLSYFFEGMRYLVEGEKFFYEKKYEDAQESFLQARSLIQRFYATRRKGHVSREFAENILKRIEAADLVMKTFLIDDHEARLLQLTEAVKRYNGNVEFCQQHGDVIGAYASFSHASFCEGLFWKEKAELNLENHDTKEAKKNLFKAKDAIKRALFINSRLKEFFSQIEERLIDVTIERIIIKAQLLWDEGIQNQELGNFSKAIMIYKKVKKYFERASRLETDAMKKRMFIATSMILDATIKESQGNLEFRINDNLDASIELFQDAAKIVSRALGYLGHKGSDDLRKGFVAQKQYYEGTHLLLQGIKAFDEKKYEEAQQFFLQANPVFTEAKQNAEAVDNKILVKLITYALNDIKGYMEMTELLVPI